MNYNPYAAPQAAPAQAPGPPPAGAAQPWEIGEVLSQAWETFKANWAVLVFTMLLAGFLICLPIAIWFAIVLVLLGGDPSALTNPAALSNSPVLGVWYSVGSNGVSIALQMLISYFGVGLLRVYIAAARGETPTFGALFSGGTRFLPMFGLRLLLALVWLLGFVCLLFPLFILYCGLWASEYFLVDATMGVVDSMKASWAATTGQKLDLFLFFLVGVLINLAGYVPCGLGLVVTVPLTWLATAVVFLRISGRGSPRALPQMGYGGAPPGYGPPPGYGGPPPTGGGYGGPPPGAPPGYGPGGGYGGPPPGGGGYGPGGGGYGGPPPGGGGYPPR